MAAGLTGSYAVITAGVNLTSLGAQDYAFQSGLAAFERKTGGGGILGITNNGGGTSALNTASGWLTYNGTDSTPTGTFSASGGNYYQDYNLGDTTGPRITAPAGTGQRTLELYFVYNCATGTTGNLNIAASISGAGAPTLAPLSFAPVIGVDTFICATFTYTAGATAQQITVDFYPDAQTVDGHTRYMGFQAAWVSTEASAGGAVLTGAASDVVTATGTLSAQINLTGSATDIASATGGLTTKVTLTGASVDVTNANGALSTNIALVGTSVSITSANGSLTAQINLNGASLAQALASAGLSTGINLSGIAQDTVLATATIQTSVNLSGNASDVATATAQFNGSAALLTGNAQDAASAMGQLSTTINLTAGALAQALATGQLVTNILLAGNAQDVATATGVLASINLHVDSRYIILAVIKNRAVYAESKILSVVALPRNFTVH